MLQKLSDKQLGKMHEVLRGGAGGAEPASWAELKWVSRKTKVWGWGADGSLWTELETAKIYRTLKHQPLLFIVSKCYEEGIAVFSSQVRKNWMLKEDLGVVAYFYNLHTWEVQAGGSWT